MHRLLGAAGGSPAPAAGLLSARGLPPSRYLAYAAQAIPRDAWTNLEFLAGLAPAAERFSLGDGETRDISLPLRPAPS